ncbi:MAG TPA: bifunctional UDP-N-acetylglucosamine diphosphorylase/glucosamine-1-phosphate N-acetyltransferase GlmU [Polyangiaceae bacterium]|nr:bifunctional UDP-N-acetylglucosamine diphosphorylase/glucosamine-1-phosphate N-acetyltransferase GlmU [Polyangiaceae bacterium]
MSHDLTALILAAGQGTRMKSALPKVLHPLAGRPLLAYPVRAALAAGATRIVVVTSGRPEIEAALKREFPNTDIVTVVQDPPRGTGDAARIALEHAVSERVLILCGDTPLLDPADLISLLALIERGPADVGLLTAELEEPHGYGRVLRDEHGNVREIREQRDLGSDAERAIGEVNAGVYAARREALARAVAELKPNNAQGEYYLTDVIALTARSAPVAALKGKPEALLGVNDREQLRETEELMFARIRARWNRLGASIKGDARLDDTVLIGPDVTIEAGVRLRGNTRVGGGCNIDVGNVVTDCSIGERAVLKPYCVLTDSRVGDGAQLGPFAHLRPESEIEQDAHIGNFVETKKTRVRAGAKANHLAYLGDGDIGEGANIGAGTIFCNYDGYQKHRTVIGKRVFIGSDSQIVAPVRIGDGAYIATGTTVTQDVPDEALAIGRVRQENKPGYAPKLKAKLDQAAREAKAKKSG